MSIPNWAISNEERDADNWLHDLRDHGAGQVLDDFGVEQGTDLGVLTCADRQKIVEAARYKKVQAIKFYNCFGDDFPSELHMIDSF